MTTITTTKLELVGHQRVSLEYTGGDTALLRVFRPDGGPVEFLFTNTEGYSQVAKVGDYRGQFTIQVDGLKQLVDQARHARSRQIAETKRAKEDL